MFKSLLPPNATRLEQAMEETVARLSDIPVPITRYIDPYQYVRQRCFPGWHGNCLLTGGMRTGQKPGNALPLLHPPIFT